MTCAEVLDLAGMYLQEPEILNRETTSNALKKLVEGVVTEICAEYYPLKATEQIDGNGTILLSSLTKTPSEVLRVTKNGLRAHFVLHPFHIKTAAGKVEVTYHYLPGGITSETAALELAPNLNARTVALGVAAEYSLYHNLYEQAVAFDQKFRESLAALTPRRGLTLPDWEFE